MDERARGRAAAPGWAADTAGLPSVEPVTAPPAATDATRRPLVWTAVVLAVGLAFVAGVLVGGALLGSRSPAVPPATEAPEPPRAVVQRYLTQASAGNAHAVRDDLCAALRRRGESVPGLRIDALFEATVGAERVDGSSASVDVDVDLPVLGPVPARIELVSEDGRWRICGGGLGR